MHTGTGAWFGNLGRTAKYWAVNARMTYSKSESTTDYFETQTGASQAPGIVPTGDGRFLTGNNSGYGPTATAIDYMPGTARRPYSAGDFSFSLFPTTNLTIVNSTSVDSNRYDGTGTEFRAISNGAAVINRFYSFHIGTGRISDALDANYHVTKWLGLNAEYQYTSRFIDNNFIRAGTTNSVDRNSARNHLNTGTFGFRLNPPSAAHAHRRRDHRT